MRRVSIDLLVVRRLVAAFVALPLALAAAPGCNQSGGGEEEEKENEESVKECDEDSKDDDCEKEAPVCGDGICQEGETDACDDCQEPEPKPEPEPEPVCGNGTCEAGETPQSCSADCAAPPTDATILVANNSSYTICYLYAAPCSSSTWGPDQLGSSTLPSGYTIEFSEVPPGCYDFRAESCDSMYWESLGNYIAAGDYYTLTLTN
ncbi:MAG: hypothetical protein JNL21_03915 [Myxococcales bacterium]|nr:hypothetical protein [Myxococcales bacterium]